LTAKPRPEVKTALAAAPADRLVSGSEIEATYRDLFLPLVRRGIRRHRLSNEDARDVVQQAFVVALTKMEVEGNSAAWLKQVVDFLAVNLKRTAGRRADLIARWMPGARCETRPPSSTGEDI
jgi:DNA-directed RNA polymerase specialized sigma24 family protein